MSDASSTPPPQPASSTAFAVYSGPSLETIKSLVASQFQVKDAFLDPNGVPTFVIQSESTKHEFMRLVEQLKEQGLIAAIRATGDTLTIKVFQKPQPKRSRLKINLGFFLATVVTVTIAGLYVWDQEIPGIFSPDPVFSQYNAIVSPGANAFLEALIFTAGLLAIIGLHEFGHKATTVYHKLDATFPYFVPGPPPIGTFGALISLKGPPTNRDQLFDLGLSGPVVGFVVTIVVGLAGLLIGPSLNSTNIPQLTSWASTCIAKYGASVCTSGPTFPSSPLVLVFLSNLANIINPNALGNHQLLFAAQIGALLTFLNIVPAWQLDGGHISRAVFGSYGHRIATFIGLALLIYSGFFFFAILVLVMMMLSGRGFAGVEPLDDVSPVSNSRKALYLVGLAMLVLTFAYSPIQL
jgi:Zn-dependent protease